MNKAFGTVQHGEVKLDQPVDWSDGTRVEVCTCAPSAANDNGAQPYAANSAAPRTGVRPEFLSALNADRYGEHAEELWPLSPEETDLLIAKMDSREPVFQTDAEFEAFEEYLRTSKAEQKELVRRQWESEEPLF